MSRSIHTTKKDVQRERKFAVHDDVPHSPQMTSVDRDEIKKTVVKLNADWQKQSARRDTPIHAELALDESASHAQIVRSLKRRRNK